MGGPTRGAVMGRRQEIGHKGVDELPGGEALLGRVQVALSWSVYYVDAAEKMLQMWLLQDVMGRTNQELGAAVRSSVHAKGGGLMAHMRP